jgi:hypothetical protein
LPEAGLDARLGSPSTASAPAFCSEKLADRTTGLALRRSAREIRQRHDDSVIGNIARSDKEQVGRAIDRNQEISVR